MELHISTKGNVTCLYSDDFNLHELGPPSIRRGSHVEPNPAGNWTADLSPVAGPILGPFAQRREALLAERQWLENHWLFLTK